MKCKRDSQLTFKQLNDSAFGAFTKVYWNGKLIFDDEIQKEIMFKNFDDMIVPMYDEDDEDINKKYPNGISDKQLDIDKDNIYNELCKKDDEKIKSGKIPEIKLWFRFYTEIYPQMCKCNLDNIYIEKDYVIVLK